MNIAIEARALSASGGGVKTYTRELVQHLLSARQHALTVFVDHPRAAGEIKAGHQEIVPMLPPLMVSRWLSRSLGDRLREIKPDVVHYTKADVPGRLYYPTVVTVYDVIPLLFPTSQAWLQRWYWPGALRRAAGAHHILTISQASKHDIIRYLQVSAEKITVTPLAADTGRFRPDIPAAEKLRVASKLGLRQPYILFVATRDERKNVGSLVRAFARVARHMPHQLVIAGKPALKADTSQQAAARLAASVRQRIAWLDFVDVHDLPALYAGAELFVWPSVYEGWALPVQEAMAAGVPVIVSDGGPLPEVVGQAGEVVNFTVADLRGRLHDQAFIEALADRMLSVLASPDRRAQMRQAGLVQVRKFSWAEVARRTLAVYEKVASA